VIVNAEGEITWRDLLEARDSGRPLEQVRRSTFLTDDASISTEPRVPLGDKHKSMLAPMGGFHHFRRLVGVMLHALRSAPAMLPLTNQPSPWCKWYRRWRNDVIGSVGSFIVKNWPQAFRAARSARS